MMVRFHVARNSLVLLLSVLALTELTSASLEQSTTIRRGDAFEDVTTYKIVEVYPSGDEYDDRRLWGFGWSSLIYDIIHCCPNGPGPGEHCGPLPCPCPPGHTCTESHTSSAETTDEGDGSGGDGSGGDGSGSGESDGSAPADANGNKSTPIASMKSSWMPYALGAAGLALLIGGMIMRKRRNAGEEAGEESGLTGAVSRRASLMAAGGGVAAAGVAGMPKFLAVPSFRRSPSGIEVDGKGAVLEPSPSNYIEMDSSMASEGHVGIEMSPSGTMAPYGHAV